MKFYKENKINPAASCLPMLVQIPIFIALYQVLRHEIAHQESHLSWLGIVPNITHPITSRLGGLRARRDLRREPDGLVVLHVRDGREDAADHHDLHAPHLRRYFILKPPVGGTASGGGFPIGLLIYWVTTNLWTVGQGLVTRQLTPKPVPPPKRARARRPEPPPARPRRSRRLAERRERRAVPAQPQVRSVKRKKKGGR